MLYRLLSEACPTEKVSCNNQCSSLSKPGISPPPEAEQELDPRRIIMSQQPCLPIDRMNPSSDHLMAPNGFEEVDVQLMDASEYLAMVVAQSKQLPDIFLSPPKDDHDCPAVTSRNRKDAPIDGSAASMLYLVSQRTNVRGPPSADHVPKIPEKWVDQTLSNFSRLREHLYRLHEQGVGGKNTARQQLPTMNDRSGWHIFCLGVDEARGNEESYFDDDEKNEETAGIIDGVEGADVPAWRVGLPNTGYTPTISLLLQMDQVLIRRALGHLIHYVRQGWAASNSQRAHWMYALLARLECPIHRDDAAVLFGLLKSLTETRAAMDAAKDKEKLARINVLITVVGIYFEQGGGFAALMQP